MNRWIVFAGLAVLVGLARAPVSGQAPDRRVALTFDDLPMTGPQVCDTVHAWRVTYRLTRQLAARRLPAAGLATPGRSCITPVFVERVLERWQEAGAVIGNHTATHPDINTTPMGEYLADIDRAQRLIDAAVETEARWFRAPYLHMGPDTARRNALSRYLSTHGYRIAPVTVDNQEWVYAAVYADARRRGDAELAERVADAYLAHIDESMRFYEELSRAVRGREIPQVLLLHANLLNADLLGQVVSVLEARGYRFVDLSEAVADSAYEQEDTYVGPRGLSWLQRWALAEGVPVRPEPREAEWVAQAFRAMQQRSEQEAGAREDHAGPAPPTAGTDAAAIAAASAAFSAAYVAGDTATLRELYAPDALLLAPERDVVGAVEAARYFAPHPRRDNLSHAMVSDELEIFGDRAVDVGTWHNRWRMTGEEPRTASGRYLVVWRRTGDGRWLIEYDMWHRPR